MNGLESDSWSHTTAVQSRSTERVVLGALALCVKIQARRFLMNNIQDGLEGVWHSQDIFQEVNLTLALKTHLVPANMYFKLP